MNEFAGKSKWDQNADTIDRMERFSKGFKKHPIAEWIQQMINKMGGEGGNTMQGQQEPIQYSPDDVNGVKMSMPSAVVETPEYDETEALAAWERTDKGMKRLFNFDYNEFLEFYKMHKGGEGEIDKGSEPLLE